MIDIYAVAGTFADVHKLATDATGVRAVNDASATNVAQMILSGSASSQSGQPVMPSFAAAYSDTEIAAVANYVASAPGRRAPRPRKWRRGDCGTDLRVLHELSLRASP
jgi:hypothetical protein